MPCIKVVKVTGVDKSVKIGLILIQHGGVSVHQDPNTLSRDFQIDAIFYKIEKGGRSDLNPLAWPLVDMLQLYQDFYYHNTELQVRLRPNKFRTNDNF